LAEVTAGQEESFDSLLKRFNRKVQTDGILAELRRREHYEKPSIKRKRKKAAKKRGAARGARVFRRASTRG
jgi:small subunit ribosomal protein S21